MLTQQRVDELNSAIQDAVRDKAAAIIEKLQHAASLHSQNATPYYEEAASSAEQVQKLIELSRAIRTER